MKIFVNARFLTQPVSGVQRYGIECSRQIKKLHPDTVFIAPNNILHKDIAEELQVKVIGRSNGHLWEQTELPFYLARKGYPPLLSLANTAPLFYSNSYITIHDLAFYHYPEWNSKAFSTWYNILIPRIAHGCKHIFTVSQTIRHELIDFYHLPLKKVSVTYNGISQRMLSTPGSLDEKQKIILSVGTFNIRKNHPGLIAGFLQSNLKNSYQLILVGDKSKVFRESGLDEKTLSGENIKIYETLSEEELISMYRKAEIVVSLSLYEGFGIPLLEGLYNRCKIVCSDIPVYKELYDGHASFCDPLNIASIKDAFNKTAISNEPEGLSGLFEKYSYLTSAKTILKNIYQLNKMPDRV